ncbi:MAG TPA: hypothetical protein VGB73_00835 [Pyrinomonadaceae bacterium]
MKSRKTRRSGLIVALALAAQLLFVSTLQAGFVQNTNSTTTTTTTTTTQTNENVGIPGSACRRRCNVAYRRCVRSGKNPTACRRQLRNCLRRCPQ